MDPKRLRDFDNHEDVRTFDLGQGATAVIAVHSTFRGPAAGGCRVWRYSSLEDAATDALRLSRGMSLKNALAELPLGGGKAVIALPEHEVDRVQLFEAFGCAVESFTGAYQTAEDVGSTVADMEVVARGTRHVAGAAHQGEHVRSNPSPWTALGVFESIKTAAAWQLDKSLDGLSVAVQGAGAVGSSLVRRLIASGARVSIADVDIARAQRLAESVGAYLISPDEIHRAEVDVFAPCALGAALNARTIPELRASIVCGGANNQLATPDDEAALAAAECLYCPDYVVNAGGIIFIQREAEGSTTAGIQKAVEAVAPRLEDILDRSRSAKLLPGRVADETAYLKIGRSHQQIAGSAVSA